MPTTATAGSGTRLPASQREWLRTAELTREYPISSSLLERMRRDGAGPPYFRHGRVVLYRRSDVEAWLEGNLTRTGD
jgi:hypothetical protein